MTTENDIGEEQVELNEQSKQFSKGRLTSWELDPLTIRFKDSLRNKYEENINMALNKARQGDKDEAANFLVRAWTIKELLK